MPYIDEKGEFGDYHIKPTPIEALDIVLDNWELPKAPDCLLIWSSTSPQLDSPQVCKRDANE